MVRWFALTLVAVVLAAGITWLAMDRRMDSQRAELEQQIADLEERASEVLAAVASSGVGVNINMMPDAAGNLTIPLEEVFSFDRHHAFRRVDTSHQAFVVPTFSVGDVRVEADRFFMSMVATSIDKYEVTIDPDGIGRVVMEGALDSATELGQVETALGSRTVAEHATYRIEATDGGPGGGEAGDTFALTVAFDPVEAPVGYTIFGPKFTFGGEMVRGEITILGPRLGAPTQQ